jgi:preprotein translocase subunit SecE
MADVTKKTVIEADAESVSVSRRRTSPLQFLMEVRREMTKVTWPSWKETWLTTMMVFIMVGLTMVFFFAVDLALNYGERLMIGAAG